MLLLRITESDICGATGCDLMPFYFIAALFIFLGVIRLLDWHRIDIRK
jgi:hypothetical protein